MVKLLEVNEENYFDIASLRVREDQKRFLASALGIIARGYVYRDCRAHVIGIADDAQIVGVALVKDMDEPPACYDLQQFLIDERFQHKGYGTQALRLILSQLRAENKYACVEVCVHKENTAALKLFEKMDFRDTGYVDERIPYCLNLMHTWTATEA